MKGSVRQRKPGFWELRVYTGLNPSTRRGTYKSRYVKGGRREAESQLAQLVTEVDRGHHRPAKGTVGVFLTSWLDGRAHELSPWTLKRYRSILANQIIPNLGAIPVPKLTTKNVDALYLKLGRQGFAESTIRQVDAILRRGIGDAARWGDRADNPVERTRPPQIKHREIESPAVESVVTLIQEADASDPEFGVFLRLAAATGARRGELCALRWSDLDGGTVKIRRSLTQDANEKDTKTHASRRLTLDTTTAAVLDAHHEYMKERARKSDKRMVPRGFIFSAALDSSRPWSPDGVSHRFARLRARLGLELRLHDLRHWSNSALLAAGLPVPVVSRRHGHRSSKMTLDVYGHAAAAGDQLAAEVMAGLLPRERGGRPPKW